MCKHICIYIRVCVCTHTFFFVTSAPTSCHVDSEGRVILEIISSNLPILQMERQRFRGEEWACSRSHSELVTKAEEGPSFVLFAFYPRAPSIVLCCLSPFIQLVSAGRSRNTMNHVVCGMKLRDATQGTENPSHRPQTHMPFIGACRGTVGLGISQAQIKILMFHLLLCSFRQVL